MAMVRYQTFADRRDLPVGASHLSIDTIGEARTLAKSAESRRGPVTNAPLRGN